MATSTDYQNLWDRFQKEGVPSKISITRFCQMNGVVYSHFEKWYKRTYSEGVLPVELVDSSRPIVAQEEVQFLASPSVRIRSLEIVFSGGLLVRHNNLDYAGLKELVLKLESLC